MEQQTRPSSRAVNKGAADEIKTSAPHGPYAGRPLDGSQYLDVAEEQEYAERRPTPEEQRPRFSYLHKEEPKRGQK